MLWFRYYNYSHFMNKETEAKDICGFSQFILPLSSGTKIALTFFNFWCYPLKIKQTLSYCIIFGLLRRRNLFTDYLCLPLVGIESPVIRSNCTSNCSDQRLITSFMLRHSWNLRGCNWKISARWLWDRYPWRFCYCQVAPTEMSVMLIKMEITHAGHLFQPHGF